MSDTIFGVIMGTSGVIIGASIALVGTAITAIFGYLMWAQKLKYQILRGEKERLEKKFEKYLDYYLDCLKKNAIDAPLGAALTFGFPEAIRNQFGEALRNGAFSSNDPKIKQKAYFDMAFEMEKTLAKYEKEIWKTYELVDPQKAFQVVKEVIQSGFLKW